MCGLAGLTVWDWVSVLPLCLPLLIRRYQPVADFPSDSCVDSGRGSYGRHQLGVWYYPIGLVRPPAGQQRSNHLTQGSDDHHTPPDTALNCSHCFPDDRVGNELRAGFYLLALVGLVTESVLVAATGRALG